MALEFGEATFELLTIREKVPVKPEPLLAAPIEVKPPKIANQADLSAFLGQIQPIQVVLQNGVWTFVTTQENYDASFFLKGDRFEETPCGIYELHSGERRSRLTNATVRIASIREVYTDDETKETWLVCAVTCYEAWGDEEKLIEVPSKQYKSIFKRIREEFRDVQLSEQRIAALDEYLSKVNQRDAL